MFVIIELFNNPNNLIFGIYQMHKIHIFSIDVVKFL